MFPFAKTSQSQQRRLSSFQGFAKCGLYVLRIGHFAVSISGLRWRRCLAQGSILKWTLDLITHPLSLPTPLSVIHRAHCVLLLSFSRAILRWIDDDSLCAPSVGQERCLNVFQRFLPVCFALLCFALLCFALLCFALLCFVLFSWRALEPSAAASA